MVIKNNYLIQESFFNNDNRELTDHSPEHELIFGIDTYTGKCNVFMEESGEEKDNDHSESFTAVIFDTYKIDMPHKPMMHGYIPQPPIIRERSTIPPIFIKRSISESKQFSDNIELQMKAEYKHEYPQNGDWEGKLEMTGEEKEMMVTMDERETIDKTGLDVLFEDDEHSEENEDVFYDSFDDPDDTDGRVAGVGELVAEGGGQGEVEEVADGEESILVGEVVEQVIRTDHIMIYFVKQFLRVVWWGGWGGESERCMELFEMTHDMGIGDEFEGHDKGDDQRDQVHERVQIIMTYDFERNVN